MATLKSAIAGGVGSAGGAGLALGVPDASILAPLYHGRFASQIDVDANDLSEALLHAVVDDLIDHHATFAPTLAPRTRLSITSLRGLFEVVAGHATLFTDAATILPLLAHPNDTADVTVRKSKLAELVWRTVQARRPDLLPALQLRSVAIASHSFEDFDWSIRLIISSDKLSAIRVPVLLLTLTLRHHDDDGILATSSSSSSSSPSSSSSSSSLQRAFASLGLSDNSTASFSSASSASSASSVTIELTREQLDRLLQKFAAIQSVLDRVA